MKFAVALLAIVSVPAFAQDRCADVLSSGTFKTERYRQTSFFQQIVLSRFLQSTFETATQDTNAGFGVSLAEAITGSANLSRSQYEQTKRNIEKEFSSRVSAAREIDVALNTGDPVLVREWGNCMAGKGGVAMHFVAESPAEATLTVVFNSAIGTSTVITDPVVLPADISLGTPSCLAKDKILEARIPCTTTVELGDAQRTWNVSLNTKQGGGSAYLGPRLRPTRQKSQLQFPDICRASSPELAGLSQCDYRGFTRNASGSYDDRRISRTVSLTEEQIRQGWIIDASSSTVSLDEIRRYSPSNTSRCSDARIDSSTAGSITYSYRLNGQRKEQNRFPELECAVTPVISISRVVLTPGV